jgi:hypothetical protein
MNNQTRRVLGLFLLVCVLAIAAAVTLIGQERGARGERGAAPPPPAPLPTTGQGKLMVFADLALFAPRTPDNCVLKNRFRKGENVGFRITVADGGSGNPETSAQVVVHVNYGGKTVDVPAEPRMLGGPKPYYANMWTAKWTVPADATTGVIRYTVTAKDKYGREGEWKPFPFETSQLTIAE